MATELVLPDKNIIIDVVDVPMTSSKNNEATLLTQAGISDKSWYISYANWRVGAGATAAINQAVTISDGETIIYKSAVPASSPNGTNLSIQFQHPIKITKGNAVTFAIGASGTAGTFIHANIGLFLR